MLKLTWRLLKMLRRYRYRLILFAVPICYILYWYISEPPPAPLVNLRDIKRVIDTKIEETLKYEKGSGCQMPELDPYSNEIMQFLGDVHDFIKCSPKKDWVRCHLSTCGVRDEILTSETDIVCRYRDIIHVNDSLYLKGVATVVRGGEKYHLKLSDHVIVSCTSQLVIFHGFVQRCRNNSWYGYGLGFRELTLPRAPKRKKKSYKVLMLGIDSMSRMAVLRFLPETYKVLKEELKATIFSAHNIVGDTTISALLPTLTGKTELELPDMRKSLPGTHQVPHEEFIFHKLKEYGYRTAYFEDSPTIGTFQNSFNGFSMQPADHYLRSVIMDMEAESELKSSYKQEDKCIGERPTYKVMLELTDQFFQHDGNLFCLTFVVDITHCNEVNLVTVADQDIADYLRNFKEKGRLKDTLLIFFSDHGHRYHNTRSTYQGKLEERLPFLSVVLPEDFKVERPSAQRHLEANADVLVTAHDIHATLLDVVGAREFWNPYKIKGADLKRGLTLLEPIPRNRSCSEAGIESHWCACTRWKLLTDDYHWFMSRAVYALLKHINDITLEEREKCVRRSLLQVNYVMKEVVRDDVFTFKGAVADEDAYYDGDIDNKEVDRMFENYQVKIMVGPKQAVYEALVVYVRKWNRFIVNTREISRIDEYGDEASCLMDKKPHLNKFCLCKSKLDNE